MFEKMYIQAALKKTWEADIPKGKATRSGKPHRDSINSLLIHDIFGGEILKTRLENDWYFYNRINGERLDFSALNNDKIPGERSFQDLPSNPEEAYIYNAKEDYQGLYTKFIDAYESAVGLKAYH